jgi:general secretion pathway protein D
MFRLMPIERLQSILVVSPQPRYLDEVQTWIERLDRYNPTKTSNMHVYRVQNVDAMELANTLSQIFGQGGRGSRTPGAALAPGMSGSTIGGGGGSGTASGFGGSSSSGFGGSSSSGFGGSSASGTGGSSSSGLGGSSSSGLGGSSSSGFGSSPSSGMGGATGTGNSTGSQFGSGSSTGSGSSFGSGSGGSSGGGFGGGGMGGSGNQRSRSSQVADLGNNMKIVADPSNNALIIMAKAQDYRDIEAVIKQLDIMPLQVLIDATIVEVGLSDQLKYGLQWYFSHDLGGTTGSAGYLGTTLGLASAAGGFTYVITNIARDMKVQLDALAATNKINVLSSPSLMVLNNQQATIKVGDQVPILTAQALPQSGVNNLVGTQSIQYKDTGVLLEVRPRVNAGGLVSLELSQAVNTLKNQGAASASGINSPTIQQRQIQSQVAVRSGETIVLGGLIIENANNTVTGIPLLSELPWLGSLFSSTEKNLQRTELVILMTPRVVENSRSSQQITNEYRHRLSGLYDPQPSPSPIIMEQGTGFNAPRINPE